MGTIRKRQFSLTEERIALLKQEGATDEDLKLLKEASDPVLWSETYLFDPDRGKNQFQCKDQFKDILRDPALNRAARVGRQQGKCESAQTHIQMADGSWPTAEEIYSTVGEGGTFQLLATDLDTMKHCKARAYITDNGLKELTRITTRSGFITTNTDNHPYLIWRKHSEKPEWIEGKNVQKGDRIAITRDLSACAISPESSALQPKQAKQSGHDIGHSETNHQYTSPSPTNKKVPTAIFASDNVSIAAFLDAYWESNQWAYIQHTIIGTYSRHKELIFGIQTLLLRLGLRSNIYQKEKEIHGTTSANWELQITDTKSLKKFISIILTLQEEKQDLLLRSRDATFCNTDAPDILWDIVKNREHCGVGQTYAITVPRYHNLITDNFITHNTVHMCIDIMHTGGTTSHAVILVFVPEKKNMNRMLEIMSNLLRGSELKSSFKMSTRRSIKESLEPEYDYEIKISTGSVIRFFFMSQKPDKARGQAATHIYIDEAEYLPDKAWPVIDGIVKGNPSIPIWASSTPCGLENTWFRNFCDKCSDPKNKRGSEYHLPSTLEKNWKEIEERLRDLIHDEVTWKLEVLAEWTEAKGAVYKKEIIDAAIERSSLAGKFLSLEDLQTTLEYDRGIKCLGVDWNNPQNGVRLVELCVMFGNPWVTRHENIAYEQYTQLVAVERILELYQELKYEIISVDAGYGHTQVELLQKKLPDFGAEPSKVLNIVDSAIKEKVIIEYTSPGTNSRRRNNLMIRTKTKIVGLVSKYLEEELVLPRCEDEYREGLVKEIRNFRRKSQNRDGGFQYTDNTHSLSALQFCVHGYDKLMTERNMHSGSAHENMSYGNLTDMIAEYREIHNPLEKLRISTGSYGYHNKKRYRTEGLSYGGKRRNIL